MEDRIRFVTHRGQQVLLADLSNCSAEEVARVARQVPSYAANLPRGTVLLLADFTGAKFDKTAIESLKQATVFDRPLLKRSAWVGADSLPHVFYENLKAFSQRDLPTFDTREQALDWLVQEMPAASGQ
ncbi:MAG TPA: hypothetical protein VF133_20940 [Terriglobales bacterium]